MEDRDQLLIERYMANELSDAERAEVEQRRKDDPLFRQELIESELVKKALEVRQREELRKRFRERDKILDGGSDTPKAVKSYRWIWIGLFVVVVIIIALWKFLPASGPAATTTYKDRRDSILQIKNQQLIDSASRHEVQPTDQKKKQEERKLDLAENRKKGKELFADNFEPYKDETMSPVSRGDDDMKPLDKFRKYYWEGDNLNTISAFSTLSADHQKNDNLRFIYAMALSSIYKIDEAQQVLIDIIENNRSIYIQEAYWYLGLLYLEEGDVANARRQLQHCVEAAEGFHKKEAAALLEKIK